MSADDQRLLKKLKSDMPAPSRCTGVDHHGGRAGVSIGTMIGWRRVATTIGEKSVRKA
ncbi:hypothetical protein ACLK1T_14100 [Escherichia coli]